MTDTTSLVHSVGSDFRQMVEQSNYFDAAWYQDRYRDVGKSGLEPVEHFLRFGRILRRDPSRLFDTDFYLNNYGASLGARDNPLVDYLTVGRDAGRFARENQGRIALIVHAFHLDVLPNMRRYVDNFPKNADQYVTCPDFFDAEALALIATHYPNAKIVTVPNAGQDIGALISLARQVDLSRYDAICKIHTKKGAKEPTRWRNALLRGTLGTFEQVDRIAAAFRDDPSLVLAGTQQLYLHGPTYMWKNGANLGAVFSDTIGAFDFQSKDWGFIGGTCFWIRGAALSEIKDALVGQEFQPAPYTDDGTLAHCVERMFGMIATLWNGRVMLCDAVDPDRIEIVDADSASSLPHRRQALSDILKAIKLPRAERMAGQLRGAINNVSGLIITGWAAVIGKDAPRNVMLRIGKHEIQVEASKFRSDLKKNGINQGNHAFYAFVPEFVWDGKPYEVVLVDSASGREIVRRTATWERPNRNYSNFQGFLKSSMTQPEVQRPFLEEDKRAFAVMEGIGNRFAKRGMALSPPPLVSVVMAVYNRANVVGEAVASVLAQTYQNFELLIVDDGSADDSVAVLKSIDDPRISVIPLAENVGVSSARNKALEVARGDIIAYLDSDNSWDSRFLAANVGFFADYHDADMIYSGIMLHDGHDKEPYAVRYCHLHLSLLENRNYIDTNVIVHRRGFLDKIIGFDGHLRRYVDYDLALRAIELGKVVSVPILMCHYAFNKTDNAITQVNSNTGHLDTLRDNLRVRQTAALQVLDQQELTRPVSIVIPNWQSEEDIRECIDALCQRDWKGMLEIIVVDNNSDDDVRTYLNEQQKSRRIALIQLERNYGFTHAVNVGIAKARSDADIILLNNDAIAQAGAIQALQAACLENPRAGMTVPQQILPAGTKTLQTHVPCAIPKYDCDVNISAHHQNIGEVPLFHDGRSLELTFAPFFAVYIRREVIDAIGPLDAEYGRHYRSDRIYSDMMYHLTDYQMFYTPKSRFIHKLQRATDHLRGTADKDPNFETMFRRNQWDAELAAELGYRQAPWDVF